MIISKEQLLKGRKYTKEVSLDNDFSVKIRSLTSGEIERLNNQFKNNKDDTELGVQLCSLAMVEPQLTPEEVRELEIADFTKISEEIAKMMGVDEKALDSFRGE